MPVYGQYEKSSRKGPFLRRNSRISVVLIMKTKLLFVFLCIWTSFFSVRAQRIEAEKITEFTLLPCGHLLAQTDNVYHLLQKDAESKVFFIYYEGRKYRSGKNLTKGAAPKMLNPVRGNALNLTKRLSLYLTKYRQVSPENIVLIDGGFMESYVVEIWIVPKNVKAPQPSPTLTAQDIKFRKGKPIPVFDCEGSYRNFP